VQRPDKTEHHHYYSNYIDQVPDGDVLALLRTSIDETAGLLKNQPATIGDHRYAPGKWTIREVINHLVDSERTFGFRAFWFARKGAGELPSNLTLFETIDDAASVSTGIASGYRFTVRAFPWIIAGHEIHHRRQLKDRYLART
jgi:hypothetical protein